ncbi:MAG: PhoH family protein, partial [Caldilineaceae bacterium]|nr:PhoH family protein [Caldilineaceae bacterium]
MTAGEQPAGRSAHNPPRDPERRRMYVLDTNVLLHDPTALFRFKENDIFLPMAVIEELDHAKKGTSEVARSARQVSRFLDGLIGESDLTALRDGLALPAPGEGAGLVSPSGKLYLQTELFDGALPQDLPGSVPDNTIIAIALTMVGHYTDQEIVLVSKDINLRIKARMLGLVAEDYYSDQVLDDVDLLYSGVAPLPPDVWERQGANLEVWQANGHTFYALPNLPEDMPVFPNLCLYGDEDSGIEVIVREDPKRKFVLQQVTDYRNTKHAVWGIMARNREQNFALNMLMDPDISFVTLLGTAGTGKTLLALAAGLAQTMEHKLYREIIVTRETIPVGEDIGFLPGSEEEKMTPWMGALLDNLEVLTVSEEGGEWGRAVTNDMLSHRIKIRSLNFMRGRTFLDRYVIIDEAQNLSAKQMKTL